MTISTKALFLTAAALGAMTASPALAQSCAPAPLKQYASLDMKPTSAGLAVPVTVNGTQKNLLVATAAGSSTLSRDAGAALGLRPHSADYTRLLDSDGFVSRHYYLVSDAQIGSLRGKDMTFMATPDRKFGLDGTLAADVLSYYDVEMDFTRNKLNFFAPDHCPGQVVYWQSGPAGGVPIRLVPRVNDQAQQKTGGYSRSSDLKTFQRLEERGLDISETSLEGVDIRTTVILDGKSFTANISTGSPISTLNSQAARIAYDVTETSPGSKPVPPVVRTSNAGVETVVVNGVRAFEHSFRSLTIGDVTVNNPNFTVRPDTTGIYDPNNAPITGTRLVRANDFPRPDITIGMDILSKLHLYFAFKEGMLYITPAAALPRT